MWNSVTALIEALPSWYIMILLPFLLTLGVWLFAHIRRDKQGKIYFYSQKYEDAKRNKKQDAILNKLNLMANSIIKNRRDILQVQLCSDMPDAGKRAAYMEYNAMGFNSWADNYVVKIGLFTEEEIKYIKNNRARNLKSKSEVEGK